MKISYATAAGRQHQKDNMPCQDIIAVRKKNDVCTLVLCDGAGSKEYGLECAQTVSSVTADYLTNNFSTFTKDVLIEKINTALEEKGYTDKNSGTTLLFVACDDKSFILGHVGDGVILMRAASGIKTISKPENGHLENITYFLPSEEAKEHFFSQKGPIGAKTAFILASDGASSLLYDPQTLKGAPACAKLISWLKENDEEEGNELLQENIEQIFREYTSDDISIAVMTN